MDYRHVHNIPKYIACVAVFGLSFFWWSEVHAQVLPRDCSTTGFIGGPAVGSTYTGSGACFLRPDGGGNRLYTGFVYRGDFQNGQFHGNGKFLCINADGSVGNVYEGRFENGAIKGAGSVKPGTSVASKRRSDWDLTLAQLCSTNYSEFEKETKETTISCDGKQDKATCENKACFWFKEECKRRDDPSLCGQITEKNVCSNPSVGSSVCRWNADQDKCQTPNQAAVSSQYGVPPGYDGPLPACAFDGSCRNVNDLVLLGVRVAKWLFGFIGVLAFAVFIAGGVMMIVSFGNTERFKQGQGLLVGAVIGIAIVFGAFILVDFILDALGVSAQFRAL